MYKQWLSNCNSASTHCAIRPKKYINTSGNARIRARNPLYRDKVRALPTFGLELPGSTRGPVTPKQSSAASQLQQEREYQKNLAVYRDYALVTSAKSSGHSQKMACSWRQPKQACRTRNLETYSGLSSKARYFQADSTLGIHPIRLVIFGPLHQQNLTRLNVGSFMLSPNHACSGLLGLAHDQKSECLRLLITKIGVPQAQTTATQRWKVIFRRREWNRSVHSMTARVPICYKKG